MLSHKSACAYSFFKTTIFFKKKLRITRYLGIWKTEKLCLFYRTLIDINLSKPSNPSHLILNKFGSIAITSFALIELAITSNFLSGKRFLPWYDYWFCKFHYAPAVPYSYIHWILKNKSISTEPVNASLLFCPDWIINLPLKSIKILVAENNSHNTGFKNCIFVGCVYNINCRAWHLSKLFFIDWE